MHIIAKKAGENIIYVKTGVIIQNFSSYASTNAN